MVTDIPQGERYLRAVKKRLVCPAKERVHLEQILTKAVRAFQEENPDADAAAWENAMGTPEEFAAELLSTCAPEDLEREHRRRHIFRWAVIGILVLITVASLLYAKHVIDTKGGRVEITTTIYTTETPPPDFDRNIVIYDYSDETD